MSQHPVSPVLEVDNLNVLGVVKDLCMHIAPGERVGLIGESGSGKTLSALGVMRLVDATGQVSLSGTRLDTLSELELCTIRGKRVAMIFQEPMTALNPLMSVGKQVREAVLIHEKISRAAAKIRAIELIEQVELSADLYRRYPHELSGGQRQRIVIAMALAHSPELLICDEPTTALDVTSQRAIVDLVLKLVETHRAGLLFITHDLGLVQRTCERVLVMKEGEIVERGEVSRILRAPEHPYTRQLLAAAQLPPARPASHSEDVVIEAKNVSKRYRRTQALKDVSLTVRAGERLGIVGGSGSGKSTLLKLIAGLSEPSAGEVSSTGSIQMVFQDPMDSLDPRMSIAEIVCEGLERTDRARAAEVLEEVGLDAGMLDRKPHEFSGGQRQRISIARALAPRPQILLADEPVSALDVSVRKKVLELLDALVLSHDLTLVFVSHDIAVVRSVCTQVAVMKDGEIVEYGEVSEVLSKPQHPYTQQLVNAVPALEIA